MMTAHLKFCICASDTCIFPFCIPATNTSLSDFLTKHGNLLHLFWIWGNCCLYWDTRFSSNKVPYFPKCSGFFKFLSRKPPRGNTASPVGSPFQCLSALCALCHSKSSTVSTLVNSILISCLHVIDNQGVGRESRER